MITISGDPKEIAALVLELQEKRMNKLLGFDNNGKPITSRDIENAVIKVFARKD